MGVLKCFATFFLAIALTLINEFGHTEANERWQLGPFIKHDSVILEPINETTFLCPIRGELVNWEAKDVFNPTALVRDGKIHLLYRAEDYDGMFHGTSRIGLAVSTDGIHFDREDQPIFYPENDTQIGYEWEGGCEDPRIVEDDGGSYFLTYTAYDGTVARLLVASSPDLRTWTKYGPVFKNADNGSYIDLWSKSGSIVARQDGEKFVATKINDKYWMYFGDTNIFIAWSTDLINWTPMTDDGGELTIVFGPRAGKFDSDLVEPGPQAVLMDAGILLIYNSRNKKTEEGGDPEIPEGTYSAGQILLNATAPWAVLSRTENYFMTPDKDYELDGQVNNVVFLEGLVQYKERWFIYYGTADSKIAVAATKEIEGSDGDVLKLNSLAFIISILYAILV